MRSSAVAVTASAGSCAHTRIPTTRRARRRLKKRTGAEVLAFTSRDGLDVDTEITEGFRIEATEFRLRAVHTPGHASNHLCYLLEEERLLFSGDHIMQGSTVVIAPPDGDMAAYLESLERIRSMRLRFIAPGHGHLIDEPRTVIDEYITHRLEREQQVVAALRAGDTHHRRDRRRGSIPTSSKSWSRARSRRCTRIFASSRPTAG